MSDFQVHDPLPVRRVSSDGGSRIEPHIGDNAPDLEILRWHAGALQADTGIVLKITTGGYRVNGREVPGIYGYSTVGRSGGAYNFDQMWAFIHGIETGYKIAGYER